MGTHAGPTSHWVEGVDSSSMWTYTGTLDQLQHWVEVVDNSSMWRYTGTLDQHHTGLRGLTIALCGHTLVHWISFNTGLRWLTIALCGHTLEHGSTSHWV